MKSTLLGPNGKPLVSLPAQMSSRREVLQAAYDAQWTTQQNAEHWSMAREGDAQIVFNQGARHILRRRARYEVANNPYLRGMVDTKATDLVGCVGLQMLNKDQHHIEEAWNSWACEVGLHEKLYQIAGPGKLQDGEGLAFLTENPGLYHSVKVDLMNFESEQMGNPHGIIDDYYRYDGIEHTKSFPLRYYIYHWNPAGHHRFNPRPLEGDWYDPSRVIHVFKRVRVGQLRGATEVGPALEYAAILRRYTLATLGAAEIAAETAMVMDTDASVDCPAAELDSEDMYVPWRRNMMFTAPYGWKVRQLKAEQPVEQYHQFVRSIATQMGRVLGIPAVLCYGDSSDYNMASGRLDVQAYIRSLDAERKNWFEPHCMEKVFYQWMRYYAGTRAGMLPSDINEERLRKQYPHTWTYRPINHSDPEKQAKADVELWQAGLLSDDQFLHSRNIDPETHYAQIEEQNKRRAAMGMPAPGMAPGMPLAGETGTSKGQDNEQQSAETEEEA